MPDERTPQPQTVLSGFSPEEMAAASAKTGRMTGGGGLWQPPSVEEAAQLFPQYEVVGLLGRGGMGAVYKARQVTLDRFVAIKLLPLEVSEDGDFADRFVREARAMAKLSHPNIIAVYDFGTTSAGHLYFVMEFIEGANLHAIIRGQELTSDQTLWLAGQVCTALAYAHHKGVVHRDIKPANVMVDTEGNAKVADFGLARLTDAGAEQFGHTQTGMVMGTPDYMAPEQMRGMNVDHRADIYSLGVMLYEMLCREVPRGIFSPPSVRTGCDGRIDSIVVRAMQSEPDRRYQSTQEMQADMEAARVPMPAPPAQSSPAPEGTRSIPHAAGQVFPPATPTPTKSKAPLYAGSVLVVMALAGAFVFGRPKAKTPALPTPAPAPIADTSLAKAQPPQKSGGPNATFGAVTKDAPFVNTLGMKFVPVPGTRIFFSIWDTRVRDYAAYGAANPNVDGMWKTGKKDGVPVGQEPDHPVINVNWEDAQAFCQWLTEKEVAAGKLPEGARYRLPTDEEWSRAARLPREDGSTPDERNRKNVPGYPWGQDWPPTRKAGNYADDTFHARFQTSPNDLKQWMQGYDDGFLTTSPVGSFPANEHGLYDMGGNVWQWCEDQWNTQQTNRGVRGASWSDGDHDIVRLSSRKMIGPTTRDLYYGFRCVLEDHPKPGPGGPRPPPERRPDGQRPPPPGNGPPREGPPGEGAPPVRQ